MQYNLATDLDQERFVNRANALLQKRCVIELTEKTFRSPNQNRYLHLLIGIIAMDTGVGLEYAKREYFKKLVNRDIFVIKKSDKFAGEIEDLRSSADLTSTAFDWLQAVHARQRQSARTRVKILTKSFIEISP